MGSVKRLPPLPSISELVRMYKLRARKQLSQNFLLDMNLCHKFVKAAGNLEGCHVCEVGPGPGGITRALLDRNVRSLSVIELDRRFLPGLEILEEYSEHRLAIHQGDVLNYDLSNFFPKDVSTSWTSNVPKVHLLGNLPFSVSTPLIVKWLCSISEHSGAWGYGRTPMTLTFQKEVAQRMVADVMTDQRSRLSIMCQYLCEVHLKFIIPGSAFVPPPDVDVGVVKFVPLKEPKIDLPFSLVEKVVRHVFHYRNKKCSKGIETLFPPDRVDLVEDMFRHTSISPHCQSYKLSIEEFDQLCHAYQDICVRYPEVTDFNFRSREGSKIWRKRRKIRRELQQDIEIVP